MAILKGRKFKTSAQAYDYFRPHLSFYYFNLKYRKALEARKSRYEDIGYIIDGINKEPLILDIEGVIDTFYNHCDRIGKKPSTISRRLTDLQWNLKKTFYKETYNLGIYNKTRVLRDKELRDSKVFIYFISFDHEGDTYYKYGITKNTLKARFKSLTLNEIYMVNTTLKNAVFFEAMMNSIYQDKHKIPYNTFSGKTECLFGLTDKDIIDIIKIMKKY